VKCRSRSTDNPKHPLSVAIPARLTFPISGNPAPRSHRPKAISGSSGSISVSNHVALASGAISKSSDIFPAINFLVYEITIFLLLLELGIDR
jgi:hypothetical protein